MHPIRPFTDNLLYRRRRSSLNSKHCFINDTITKRYDILKHEKELLIKVKREKTHARTHMYVTVGKTRRVIRESL